MAAALVVVAALGVGAALEGRTPTTPDPTPPIAAPGDDPGADPAVPVLRADDGPSALRAGLGSADYGVLTDPGRLAGCLAAHDLPAGTRPLGARRVVVDGVPGVLLVLPTGVAARFRLLVVGDGCAAGAPLTVSDRVVGR